MSSCINRGESQISKLATSVPGREALRIQACEEITESDQAVRHALSLVLGHSNDPVPSPTEAAISEAYGLFKAGDTPSAEVMSALKEVVDEVDKLDNSSLQVPLEKWRFLLLTLCMDPYWQVL